jgi:hypothetical protein
MAQQRPTAAELDVVWVRPDGQDVHRVTSGRSTSRQVSVGTVDGRAPLRVRRTVARRTSCSVFTVAISFDHRVWALVPVSRSDAVVGTSA